MIDFRVNDEKCIRCGACVADCPARIISMPEEGSPGVAEEKERHCYRCRHCLAVCPTGAVSILGVRPEDTVPLEGNYPEPDRLETLVKGRRSVRKYRDENLDRGLMRRLLEAAWHAPTGHNARQVLFTVVDDREKMDGLRKDILAGLGELVRAGTLPEGLAYFAQFVRVWEERGTDIIFRGAPHLLVASAPRHAVCAHEDCLIALSYFELLAQASGVGTVWCGFAKFILDQLLPSFRDRLGIPEDHFFGYAMLFGKPGVRYHRTVQYGDALIRRFEG